MWSDSEQPSCAVLHGTNELGKLSQILLYDESTTNTVLVITIIIIISRSTSTSSSS